MHMHPEPARLERLPGCVAFRQRQRNGRLIATDTGDSEVAVTSLHGLGDVAPEQGDVGLAAERYRSAISSGSSLAGGQESVCWSLAGLASVAGRCGEVDRAGTLW